MAQKVKGFRGGFSRLDTIMETKEIEESIKTVLPQKHMASSAAYILDSVDGENIQHFTTLRRKRIACPSTRIRNRTEQEELKRLPPHQCTLAEPLVIIRNGERTRTDQVNNAKVTQKDTRKLRDMRQVEMLFPEFFPKRTHTYFDRQSDWYSNYQKNMKLVNEKVNEDPVVQSWLSLFGARTCI